MPILLAPIDQEMTIIKISLDEKEKKHFENLGITLNSKVTVLENVSGNVVLLVKGSRIAIDKELATKIFVA